jgi:hypothetical protein
VRKFEQLKKHQNVGIEKRLLLEKLLASQKDEHRNRYSVIMSRGSVLVVASGIIIGLIGQSGISPQFLTISIVLALGAAILGTISIMPRTGKLIKLSELELEIQDKDADASAVYVYRRELKVAKQDESLLIWRNKWQFYGFLFLASSILFLGIALLGSVLEFSIAVI